MIRVRRIGRSFTAPSTREGGWLKDEYHLASVMMRCFGLQSVVEDILIGVVSCLALWRRGLNPFRGSRKLLRAALS
jgi:hypothetical protein